MTIILFTQKRALDILEYLFFPLFVEDSFTSSGFSVQCIDRSAEEKKMMILTRKFIEQTWEKEQVRKGLRVESLMYAKKNIKWQQCFTVILELEAWKVSSFDERKSHLNGGKLLWEALRASKLNQKGLSLMNLSHFSSYFPFAKRKAKITCRCASSFSSLEWDYRCARSSQN